MLDLRIPSGLFFVATGLILTALGVLWPGSRAPMTNSNVNLLAGLVMLAFGGVLLFLARKKV